MKASVCGAVSLSLSNVFITYAKTCQELQNLQLLISLSSIAGMISVFRDDNSPDIEKGMH